MVASKHGFVETWGWAGSAHDFLTTPREVLLERLGDHLVRLLGKHPSSTQLGAWTDEHSILAEALQTCITVEADAPDWSIIFEYELPLEGGRRPDVVVLAGESVIVLEFKTSSAIRAGDLDQTRGLRAGPRRLSQGVARPTSYTDPRPDRRQGERLGRGRRHDRRRPGSTGALSGEAAASDGVDRPRRLAREPLRAAADARRRGETHLPTRTAPPRLDRAVGRHPAGARVSASTCAERSEASGERALAFVTGVPGAGKTLVGLRLVYEGSTMEGRAAFLSGNGPLVDVLQYALQSRVFVRDLHKAILDYGKRGKTPREHIIVFDEAQRAWDREHMERERGRRRERARAPDARRRARARLGGAGRTRRRRPGDLRRRGSRHRTVERRGRERSERWKIHCPREARDDVRRRTMSRPTTSSTSRCRCGLVEPTCCTTGCTCCSPVTSRAPLGEAPQVYASNFPMYLTRDLERSEGIRPLAITPMSPTAATDSSRHRTRSCYRSSASGTTSPRRGRFGTGRGTRHRKTIRSRAASAKKSSRSSAAKALSSICRSCVGAKTIAGPEPTGRSSRSGAASRSTIRSGCCRTRIACCSRVVGTAS